MFQHILVCCDGSVSAEQAALAAASLARKSLCGVTLLYVLDLNAVLPPAIGVWEGAAGPREIAQAYATSMHTLNVVEPFSFGPVLSDEDYALLVSGDPANVAGRYLAQVKASIGSALTEAGVFCTFHQEHGVAEEKIVQFAQEHGSDLIVMGSRGLGGFERMLLGSVSNYVAYHAPCPVLIVR